MMNAFKRCMIFVTFVSSCFTIALLIASLGTNQWVNALAERTTNPHESEGKIHFGLFDGRKDLNVAYGWRTYEIDMIHLLKHEPEILNYWFWLGTVACISFSLLFSAVSGILAVINTATNTTKCLARFSMLYVWNTLALIGNLGAIGFWIAQYFLRIQNNVLTREDRDNMWTSEGRAELGYSFWFVVGAAAISFVNLIILCIVKSEKELNHVVPMLEEKTNGAIMLY